MGELSVLTGTGNYFENFDVGMAIRHARGKTVTNLENVLITNMVMNTAQAHFNADALTANDFGGGGVVSYGGVNFSLVLGLASQDCCENALAELELDNVKLTKPVKHGDTLSAYSEVLEKRASDREDAGVIRFRHFGYNQHGELVAQLERTVLLKRRSHWSGR